MPPSHYVFDSWEWSHRSHRRAAVRSYSPDKPEFQATLGAARVVDQVNPGLGSAVQGMHKVARRTATETAAGQFKREALLVAAWVKNEVGALVGRAVQRMDKEACERLDAMTRGRDSR